MTTTLRSVLIMVWYAFLPRPLQLRILMPSVERHLPPNKPFQTGRAGGFQAQAMPRWRRSSAHGALN